MPIRPRRLRRLTRPVRHALAHGALRALVALLRRLPGGPARALGAGLGRLVGRLARADTRTMRRQLARLPDPPRPGACWASLGRRFVELARGEVDRVHLPPAAEATLRGALAQGRGVLVCTAHLGNWELLAARLAAAGVDAGSLSTRDRAGPLYRWLRAHRARLGVHTRGPGGGALWVRQRARAGLATGIFIDQRTAEPSALVPFLGAPAPTPLTAARLQRLTGAVPVFAVTVPRPGGGYVLRIEPAPTHDLVPWCTARLEALVRAHPAEWIWLHDRWGPPPDAVDSAP